MISTGARVSGEAASYDGDECTLQAAAIAIGALREDADALNVMVDDLQFTAMALLGRLRQIAAER